MTKKGSIAHENALQDKIREMRGKGWRVIDLDGKSPDAIGVKDGKIIAIEVLKKIKTERRNPDTIRTHGRYVWRYQGGMTQSQKREIYSMFDDVEFGFWTD